MNAYLELVNLENMLHKTSVPEDLLAFGFCDKNWKILCILQKLSEDTWLESTAPTSFSLNKNLSFYRNLY